MKNDEIIDTIEPVPKLTTTKCKIISACLRLFLSYTTVLTAAVMWIEYDYFVGIATLLISFIVMGIIRSKLRNSVIPLTQREHHYNDGEIARFYTAKMLC